MQGLIHAADPDVVEAFEAGLTLPGWAPAVRRRWGGARDSRLWCWQLVGCVAHRALTTSARSWPGSSRALPGPSPRRPSGPSCSYERHPVGRRNLVSVLATVAELNALLAAASDAKRREYLTRAHTDGRTRLDLLLGGELDRVTAEIDDVAAGPYDVPWDGNWPSSRSRLRGWIPASARAGDVLAGGDGGGTCIAIRIVEDDDGVLTGEEVPGSWRDPPFEDVWLVTYSRLERLYPEEIPLPPQA